MTEEIAVKNQLTFTDGSNRYKERIAKFVASIEKVIYTTSCRIKLPIQHRKGWMMTVLQQYLVKCQQKWSFPLYGSKFKVQYPLQ